jgi:hypothetical protein
LFYLGLAIQCQIVGENLDCILILPQKYATFIEGLAGNFNGNYSDDLFNRLTNQTIPISPASGETLSVNDTNILNACLSCKFILKKKKYTNHNYKNSYCRESVYGYHS